MLCAVLENVGETEYGLRRVFRHGHGSDENFIGHANQDHFGRLKGIKP